MPRWKREVSPDDTPLGGLGRGTGAGGGEREMDEHSGMAGVTTYGTGRSRFADEKRSKITVVCRVPIGYRRRRRPHGREEDGEENVEEHHSKGIPLDDATSRRHAIP